MLTNLHPLEKQTFKHDIFCPTSHARIHVRTGWRQKKSTFFGARLPDACLVPMSFSLGKEELPCNFAATLQQFFLYHYSGV